MTGADPIPGRRSWQAHWGSPLEFAGGVWNTKIESIDVQQDADRGTSKPPVTTREIGREAK